MIFFSCFVSFSSAYLGADDYEDELMRIIYGDKASAEKQQQQQQKQRSELLLSSGKFFLFLYLFDSQTWPLRKKNCLRSQILMGCWRLRQSRSKLLSKPRGLLLCDR